MVAGWHKEDIKAGLRKEFGSLLAFERKFELPARSTKDVLRGRSVRQTERAIAQALQQPLHVLFPRRYSEANAALEDDSSTKGDNNAPKPAAHRQIAGAN